MELMFFIFVGLAIVFTQIKRSNLFLILLASFVLKAALALTQRYVRPIFVSSDQGRFYDLAVEWSSNGFWAVLPNFDPMQSYVISWVSALVFSIFGNDIIYAQFIIVYFALGAIIYSYKIAFFLSQDKSIANIVALVVAVLPSLNILTAALLRENFIIFFILASIYNALMWHENNNFVFMLKSFIFIILAGFFHGALYLVIPIYGFLFLKSILKSSLKLDLKLIYLAFFLVALSVSFAGLYVLKDNVKVKMAINLVQGDDRAVQKLSMDDIASSDKEGINSISYPQLEGGGFLSLISSAPVRMIFFSYTPAPWHFFKITDIPRILDSFIFSWLLFYALYLRVRMKKNSSLKVVNYFILPVLLFMVVMYSFGSFDVGTGQRHRLKIEPLLIAVYLSIFIYRVKSKKLTSKLKKVYQTYG